MRDGSKFYANISTSSGSSVDSKTLLSSMDNVNIKALKACDVIPKRLPIFSFRLKSRKIMQHLLN
ncbi:hypothetical protein IC611_11395 [Proteus mirabilis]